MTPVASRLKDALWSIRCRYGMENDIDRIIPFLVFDRDLSRTELEDLLVDYPKRPPADFKSALLAQIQKTIRVYWFYRVNRKGYHKVLKGIYFLEHVVRYGFEGCCLIFDADTGYYIELKPEIKDKIKQAKKNE